MAEKNLKYIKGYKEKIRPSPEALDYLKKYIGATRWIYNEVLAQVKSQYTSHLIDSSIPKPDISSYTLCHVIKYFRNDINRQWLKEVPSAICREKILDLSKAFTNFFGKSHKKKSGYPKFKKKNLGGSFRLDSQRFKIKNNYLYIVKCPVPIKVLWSRKLPSQPSQVTITLTPSGDWYASFLCQYEPCKTLGIGIIGIDLGITNIATLSNGVTIPNPRYYQRTERHLNHLQHKMSRKQKGSKNRNKVRIKVAKYHQYIANQRKDFLHKLSTALIRENQAICIEDLSIGNMARNRHLSKHIMTAGWGMFRRMLEYKAKASQHCRLIIADRWYPSTQECSVCFNKPSKKLSLGIRSWTCEHCGANHQRDENASENLRQLAEHTLYIAKIIDPSAMIIHTGKYQS